MLSKIGASAIDLALDTPANRSVLRTMISNWGFDFGRCIQLAPGLNLDRIITVKMLRILFKRLSKEILVKAVIASSHRRFTLLSQAVSFGRVELLEPLIRAGPIIDPEGGASGAPLLTACSFGRFSSIKYLVRAGAKIFVTKAGRPFKLR